MVDTAGMAKAAERREARKLARENAVAKAHEQQAGLSATLVEARERPAPAKTGETSRERRATERAAAEVKATEQARTLKVSEPDVDGFMRQRAVGRIPLNILNARAQQIDAGAKSHAHNVADAAGRAAFAVARGRADPTKGQDQHARMRDAQARMDAAKAASQKAE